MKTMAIMVVGREPPSPKFLLRFRDAAEVMREIYHFADFTLDVSERRLSHGATPLPLPPKSLDVLTALVRRAGRLVTKRELLRSVWPDVFVEEGILTVHVAAARKVLDAGGGVPCIDTVIGSGYRFVAAVTRLDASGPESRQRTQEAAEAIARGRSLLMSGASIRLPAAVSTFVRALQLDESAAAAHAGLALARCAEATSRTAPHAEAFSAAKTSALRALAMDVDSADALTALGVVLLFSEWDWPSAERSLRRALTVNRAHAEAQLYLGMLLEARGHLDEGADWKQRALRAQPESPLIAAQIAVSHWYQRRNDDAIDWANRALRHEPRQLFASEFLAVLYWMLGDVERMVAERLRRARALELGDVVLERMTQNGDALRAEFGRRGAAGVNTWLLQHFATGDDGHAALLRAVLLASSGSLDSAFEEMDRALQEREPSMIDVMVSPVWDPLRSDPRFAARLRQIGL